jgi:hypothetical protein
MAGASGNAFDEQRGILAAAGQDDASSLAGAAAQAQRHGQGAQIAANTDLGIKAAGINNQAGLTVGSSILNNLPTYRPDDLSGLAQLGLYDQSQQFERGLIDNAMNRPTSPGMTQGQRPVGGRYANSSADAGFSWMNPTTPQTSQLNTTGQRLDKFEEDRQQRRLMGGQ